jgi:uncharacterized protein
MGLVLDLRRIGEGRSTVSDEVDSDELGLSWPGLHFGREIKLDLEVGRSGCDLDIIVHFRGYRRSECDRCLEPFQAEFDGSLRAIGRRESAQHELAGQDGVIFHDGHEIELTSELRQAILIEIPIQSLCSEGCRGLCSTCGANLNLGACGCVVEHVDPRWAVLRKARELG